MGTAALRPLSTPDAVELGHALMQYLAEQMGARVLMLKGPATDAYGLRSSKGSMDVDVLVDPARFDDFCSEMQARGWVRRESTFLHSRHAPHTATFVNETWPCDIDLHRFFPGFLKPADVVFEELWSDHESYQYGHYSCNVPNRLASILVLALHSLRSTVDDPRHHRELSDLVTLAQLSPAEKRELSSLAERTGSDQSLRSFLGQLGIKVRSDLSSGDEVLLREWERRVAAGARGAHFWLDELSDTAAWHWPHVLWRAFWPTRADLQVSRPWLEDSRWARTRARVARLGWGLSTLPKALITRLRIR